MPDVHAKLSASGSKKWLKCPGSVKLEAKVRDTPSEHAQEGTNAHALGEAKIRLALKQYNRVKYHNAVKSLEITEDMEDYTENYKDFVLERYNEALSHSKDAKLFIEQRLDFSDYVPDGFGTGDVVIVYDGAIEIIDLKYGTGVKVSAQGNPQLRLYALGAVSAFDYLYDIQSVTMTIYQPRIDNIDSETICIKELELWGEYVKERAMRADDDGDDECFAGTHCDEGFCKARAICRAYAEERLRLAVFDFAKPQDLSIEEIAEIIDQSEKISKWVKLVSEYALSQAVNEGVKYPGFKLVEGKSIRKYARPDTEIGEYLLAMGYQEEDIYKKELKGITDMEKLVGKKTFKEIFRDFVIKPQGRPTLVHTDDKRPEIRSVEQANEDFEKLINS